MIEIGKTILNTNIISTTYGQLFTKIFVLFFCAILFMPMSISVSHCM